MTTAQIAIIGGGTMASALLTAALKHDLWQPPKVVIAEPNSHARNRLTEQGCLTYPSAADLPAAQAYLLCVKPQDMPTACAELRNGGALDTQPVISIAAGITTAALRDWLDAPNLVRVMPNTPAVIGEGCSFAYAAKQANDAAKKLTGRLLSTCGSLYWVDSENLLDAATALSGSGPAYAYLIMEIMTKTALELGLPRDIALAAAAQTLRGSSAMVTHTGQDPAQLRQQVTSKNGTTAAALASLSASGFSDIFADAIRAAHRRAKEMAKG